MARLTKSESRKRWAEFRALFAEWDPLGLVAAGAPRDEYDCVLGPLMRRLEAGASDDELSAYLDHEFEDHFGCPGPSDPDRRRFIGRARAWFSSAWPDTHV